MHLSRLSLLKMGSSWMNFLLVWMAHLSLSTFFEQISFLRTVSQQSFEVDESETN